LTLKGANADINPVTETRGDESTIIGDGSSAAVTIQGESVALDGFTITNGGFDGGLELSGYSHLIKNNIITNNNGIGIYLNAGSGHNIFRHNLISNNKESGWNTGGAMLQTGCYDNLFEENKFINNQHSGVLLYFNNPTYAWMMKEGEDPNSWSGNTFIGNTFQAEPSDDTLYYYGLALLESEGTTISNNSFTNWHNAAITIQHASKDNIVEENNIINNERGIKIFDEPVNTQIHYNNISGNSLYAIENKGTALINATNNWWGDISGPYNEVTNVGGTGNAVSDNVDYRPWCAEESCSSIDSTAPYIVGGTPTPSSVGIDPATNIEINFSEPVQCSNGDWSSCITITDGDGNSISGTVKPDMEDNYKVTFIPTNNLASNSKFTIVLTGVIDMSGNELVISSPYDNWTFTTATHYEISLLAGWNLISFPVTPTTWRDVEGTLGNAKDKIESIWTYDGFSGN